MKSKLNKEYKRNFKELRVIVNAWDLIHDSPIDEYDDINLNIVWDVIRNEIPLLIKQLKLRVPPEN